METTSREWQRRAWDARVETWSDQVEHSPAFARVRDVLTCVADPRRTDRCVDLGAGSGFIALHLAPRVASMLAVDVSPEMLTLLAERAEREGLGNVTVQAADVATLDLPECSLDLVVSNYALHSVPHEAKERVLAAAYRWLRPGGRIVIGDMMMGRGLSARDRGIFLGKAWLLLRRGPAGLWRLLRNATQLGLGVGENRPATPQWWQEALVGAGFTQVRHTDVVAEAGVVAGVKP